MNVAADPQQMLMELAADCRHDPLGFAKAFWPERSPRLWQATILDYIGERLRDPKTRNRVIRVAVASGNGIGKSALIGMILNWAMTTCAGCRCKVAAGKAEQVETKTSPEVGSWFKASLAADWFEVHTKSIRSIQTERPENWRVDFETWTEEKPDTFQGLHNIGKRIVIVFDEGSSIPAVIYDAAETSFTDDNTEFIFLAFGNPVRNTGRFREIFGSHKHMWKTFQIDSRTVEGVNKAQAEEWIEQWGEDSDFVRVKVRGEFPRAGSTQFISGETVAICRKHKASGYERLPKIISVDVARFGDDQTVIGKRQGRRAEILAKYRGLDTVQVAERVIEFIKKEAPDGTIIDGDGIGAGVLDHIKFRGFGDRLFEFHGGAAAHDASMYFNRRAEVWGLMRDWLLASADIPDDAELATDLTSPEYGFSNKNQIQLERKQDMKSRGLASPDCGDMLAMTFAVTIAPPPVPPPIEYRYPGQDQNSWMMT